MSIEVYNKCNSEYISNILFLLKLLIATTSTPERIFSTMKR